MNDYMIEGFRFAAVSAQIKKANVERIDFGLIVADAPALCAGMTTTNLVAAAPVQITRQRLAKGLCQAILVNSGNANAYTGPQGMSDTIELIKIVAKQLEMDSELIIPMSTGVIGIPLPMERMRPAVPKLVGGLRSDRFMDVAQAIMTTDTRPKTISLTGDFSGGKFKIVGMAKGAGMIAPNMATMLSIILTDIKVNPAFLKKALKEAVNNTFNRITVDGDTSTNDTVLILAGGSPNTPILGSTEPDKNAFSNALNQTCTDLARQIVSDGEGATKVVEIEVVGAPDVDSAHKIARKIAESPLVKSAFHGEDPNWGRIISSAGSAGVPFNPDKIDLSIGGVIIVSDGLLVSGEWETAAHNAMKNKEFSVLLNLNAGECSARLLTTDLSEEYVTINADYRS